MPKWKPKSPREKFQRELDKLDAKIAAKRAELQGLEKARKQIEMVVSALSEVDENKALPRQAAR